MTGSTALAVARNGDLALTGAVGSLDAYLERVSHIPVLTREEERALGEELLDAFMVDYNNARPALIALDSGTNGQ